MQIVSDSVIKCPYAVARMRGKMAKWWKVCNKRRRKMKSTKYNRREGTGNAYKLYF